MCVVFLVLLNSSSNGLEARYESADPSYVVAYPGLALVGVERRAVLKKKIHCLCIQCSGKIFYFPKQDVPDTFLQFSFDVTVGRLHTQNDLVLPSPVSRRR